MYKLREKFCSENPVFSLFLLFYTGNGCGYVNRIYDSKGGTGALCQHGVGVVNVNLGIVRWGLSPNVV